MGSTSQDLGHKSSKKIVVISGVTGVKLIKTALHCSSFACTDSMEYRGLVLRAETPGPKCAGTSR